MLFLRKKRLTVGVSDEAQNGRILNTESKQP